MADRNTLVTTVKGWVGLIKPKAVRRQFRRGFAGFIRAKAVARHFGRLAILEAITRSGANRDASLSLSDSLLSASHDDIDTLLTKLNSRADGLTDAEAEAIRDQVGLNDVEHDKPLPWWRHLAYCYENPFNLLLTLLAAISYYTKDTPGAIIISIMVVLSTLLRFAQEARSNKAADKLKEMVSNTATVIRHNPGTPDDDVPRPATQTLRGGQWQFEIPIKQLVPGDVVTLSAGDMIPADLRVLSAKDLFVSQSAVTGESLPVEKFPITSNLHITNPLELENILFMGTNVVSGSAHAVVVNTGVKTYFGALAEKVVTVDRTSTAFQEGVNRVSWLLIRFMLVMTPIVFLINGLTKWDWLEAFMFALSVAVGLTPEMLPMIVTSTLAKGAVLLSRKKVIVKRLDAIQNFGAMNILCTDKTGTLTQDKIILARHTDAYGEELDLVLQYCYLNSYYQTGLKNLLDVAVLEHADVSTLNFTKNFRKVDEIPFDFHRRRMSVVMENKQGEHLLICKGAVQEVIGVCNRVKHGEAVDSLTTDLLERIREVTRSLNEEGLRVVAVAAKTLPANKTLYNIKDEADLILIGYIAFLDPPKETTAPALKALQKQGIAVKILTGDNELVTAKICREVDFPVQGTYLGPDIEKMSDEQLAKAVEDASIFARLTPLHKERIVHMLRRNGHVVGFLGDGINDASALRAADIGISVDSAVDIAKEAADMILLEKSLMVLEEGVMEGRKTFVNMLKYIKMTTSSNFGNVFSVLIASAFLPFLPMLPLHLLVQNLLYDISQTAIPFDHVDEELLQEPQQWNPNDIGRFMMYFGPISSIFDIVTFCLMWFVFGANAPAHQTLFQSGWFVEGLLSQTLIVHMIRTQKVPFLQSHASWPLLLTTLCIMAVGIFIPMGPMAQYFTLQPLPYLYFPFLILILMSYMILIQAMKGFYIKRFGWQ